MNEISFVHLPKTRNEHFRLYFHAAVLDVLEAVSYLCGSSEAGFQQFPFLADYQDQLARCGLEGKLIDEARRCWQEAITNWEVLIDEHLPLRALARAGDLDYETLSLLITVALVEEDARFGILFDKLQSGPVQHRPTLGLLYNWQGRENHVRSNLRHLEQLGLIQILNPDAPRLEQALVIPAPIWDAIRGEQYEAIMPGVHFQPPGQLLTMEELIVPPQVKQTLDALPQLLVSGEVQTVMVRGPRHNGRHTLLGMLARHLGRGVLSIDQPLQDPDVWRRLGVLATILHALPIVEFDLAPGESIKIPHMPGLDGPVGVVLSKTGSVSGPLVDRSVTIQCELPSPQLRTQHWVQTRLPIDVDDIHTFAEHLRLTSGNIHRIAKLAQTQASLSGRDRIGTIDVKRACRTLNGQTLESLATYLEVTGDWSRLAVGEETLQELLDLEVRCRKRERLQLAASAAIQSQVNMGVRALFSGPSGTGKTLAACLLAAQLQLDIYRLDLSAVVNKYIGETEKNLNRVFSSAEELDIILLIDEGDALLTRRTSVSTSNDRYANLETNFLLQRLESFTGIVIVTTNSGEHIDRAFQRRMDVTIDFRSPESMERWQIWQLHLPESSLIDPRLMSEIASRCQLTGGQIRNAALHATLLAVNDGGIVTSDYVEAAVRREYRKIGAVCPLRSLVVE